MATPVSTKLHRMRLGLYGVACVLALIAAYSVVDEEAAAQSQKEGAEGSNTNCPAFGKRYGIMMDAGSTGSRTHVYSFDFHPDGSIALEGEVFEEVKPGLSSFRGDPEAAAASIRPLMETAARIVPSAAVRCTPIALKATAGLRLIGAEESAAILASVGATMRSYGFAAPTGDDANADKADPIAVIMDGRDEGPFAWTSVNFLVGALTATSAGGSNGGSSGNIAGPAGHQTAAIMDLGGASTQIVFQPDRPAVALAGAPKAFVYEAALFGSKHTLYQNSYLGLGLKEAVKAAGRTQLKNFACLPKGFEFDVSSSTSSASSAGEKKASVVTNKGPQSFAACAAAIGEAVIDTAAPCPAGAGPCAFNGIYQPKLRDSFSGPIYAFSYFSDVLDPYFAAASAQQEDGQQLAAAAEEEKRAETVSVGTYKKAGELLCEGGHGRGLECAEVAFAYALLSRGYSLADSERLHISKQIRGFEVAWSLGAMIELMR